VDRRVRLSTSAYEMASFSTRAARPPASCRVGGDDARTRRRAPRFSSKVAGYFRGKPEKRGDRFIASAQELSDLTAFRDAPWPHKPALTRTLFYGVAVARALGARILRSALTNAPFLQPSSAVSWCRGTAAC